MTPIDKSLIGCEVPGLYMMPLDEKLKHDNFLNIIGEIFIFP